MLSSAASTDALAAGSPDGMGWAGGAAFIVVLVTAADGVDEADGDAGAGTAWVVSGALAYPVTISIAV
ncbi:MAG TPA: hypothetical protein VIJ11_05950 [Galbitalea sp.]